MSEQDQSCKSEDGLTEEIMVGLAESDGDDEQHDEQNDQSAAALFVPGSMGTLAPPAMPILHNEARAAQASQVDRDLENDSDEEFEDVPLFGSGVAIPPACIAPLAPESCHIELPSNRGHNSLPAATHAFRQPQRAQTDVFEQEQSLAWFVNAAADLVVLPDGSTAFRQPQPGYTP